MSIGVGAILAGLLTHAWLTHGRETNLLYWMISAWILTVADIFFALRPELPYWIGRLVPTLLVTVGHAGLLLGTQVTAGLPRRVKLTLGLILLHAMALVLFLVFARNSVGRSLVNGFIWSGLSLACAWSLRKAPPMFWQSPIAPVTAFLFQTAFILVRMVLAIAFERLGWTAAAEILQTVADIEVSLFIVALFVSLLLADLQLYQQKLRNAQVELQTLSGLLPICAWCKKVRGDDGYWEQVDDYFTTHTHVEFTHGMCVDCFKVNQAKMLADTPKAPTP